MLLLLLTLQAFSASPSLHKSIHSDAASSKHECAITLLSNGHVDQPAYDFEPVPPVGFFTAARAYEAPLVAGRDYRISVSRGPPALL